MNYKETFDLSFANEAAPLSTAPYMLSINGTPNKALLFFHSWNGVMGDVTGFPDFAAVPDCALISPDAGAARNGQAGTDQQMAEIKAILDAVQAAYPGIGGNVYAVAFSGGGFTAAMFAATYPGILMRASLWFGITDLALWRVDGAPQGNDVASIDAQFGGPPDTDERRGAYYRRAPVSRLPAVRNGTFFWNAGAVDDKVPPMQQRLAHALAQGRSGVVSNYVEWPGLGHSFGAAQVAAALEQLALTGVPPPSPPPEGETEIPAGTGSLIGSMTEWGGLAAAYDYSTLVKTAAASSYRSNLAGWHGKSWVDPKRLTRVRFYPCQGGFVSSDGNGVRFTVYGKNGAVPSGPADPECVLLGTTGIVAELASGVGTYEIVVPPDTPPYAHHVLELMPCLDGAVKPTGADSILSAIKLWEGVG